MSIPPTTPTTHDAVTLVSISFRHAWARMVYLLFRGPGANVRAWLAWGFIALAAGIGAGGNSASGNIPGGGNFPGGRDGHAPELPFLPELDGLLIGLLLLILVGVLLVAVVVTYFQARFRFVLTEGVVVGEPRIKGVFRRTRHAGHGYFGFLLLVRGLMVGVVLALVLPLLFTLYERLRTQDGPLGTQELFGLLGPLFAVLLVLVPTILAGLLVEWFAYHVAVPYAWLRGLGFGAALHAGWRLLRQRVAAFLLFGLANLAAGIAGAMAAMVAVCCTCIGWLPLAGIAAGLGWLAFTFPLSAPLTVPLALAVLAVVSWLIASLLVPVPVFFRAWSLAFVAALDPAFAPSAPAAATPPTDPAPPTDAASPLDPAASTGATELGAEPEAGRGAGSDAEPASAAEPGTAEEPEQPRRDEPDGPR